MTAAALPDTITIRPYRVSDANDVYTAVIESIDAMSRWMPWCHSGYSIHDAINWLMEQESCRVKGTAHEFAIIGPAGQYLGGCGLNQINREYRLANLGYWVRSAATGHGVATRAVRLLAQWAMVSTDLVRLEIVIATGNTASIRVAEKAGASPEGVLRDRLILSGRPHDALMFSLVRSDLVGSPEH